jgi:hypothetical protein
MRSHPLDNDREPRAKGVFLAAAAAAVVLAGAGFGAHTWNEARREANVARAVLAKGYGPAEVEAIQGPECWRAREGYRWRTATASGWACAGPRDEVTVHEGAFKGGWP